MYRELYRQIYRRVYISETNQTCPEKTGTRVCRTCP